MRYRKKPVVVEAVKITAADFNGKTFDGSPFSETPTPKWIMDAIKSKKLFIDDAHGHTDYARWAVKTLEGTMTAGPDDYLIRGVEGELYFCKPDIFKKTYEPA